MGAFAGRRRNCRVVDAVIGGGGLVLIPLIMAVIPGVAPATALATNKLAAVSGTASAAFTLMRTVRPPMKETLKLALIAGIAPQSARSQLR